MSVVTITSTSNNLVKHVVKIREDSSYRQEHQQVLVSGRKVVAEIAQIFCPLKIFVEKTYEEYPHASEICKISPPVLKKITGLVNPEGIAALFKLPKPMLLDNKKRILVTEDIADPGNLGTLMRTALALGFEGIFLLGKGVDPFHDKVLRASRGALFKLNYEMGNWQRLLELTKNRRDHCFVADIHGEPLNNIARQHELILLLSNESQGVSAHASNFGKKICIPMAGPMESLNVSIAGAILMYNLSASN
jgi:TrmH family RNA methyltransferase